jgi:translocation and assembly module TamA
MAAARAEYGALLGALYAAGRYSGVVTVRVDGREAADIPILGEPARISRVEVAVDSGGPFRFGRALIAPLAQGTELPEGFATGKPAPAGQVREATGAAIDGWRDLGHAKADVASQRVVADHARAILDADIRLSPGPRLRFGTLSVSGQTRMREDRIRAIAGLPEGQVFSPAALRRSAERLRRTGVFRSVTLTEADRIATGGFLPIYLVVEEQRARRFGFGAEIASSEGLTLTSYWLHRNLLGGAERLRLGGRIGGIGGATGGEDYEVTVSYARPATFTPDTSLLFDARVAHEQELDYRQDIFELGGGLEHIFSETLTGSAMLRYRFSEVSDELGTTRFRSVELPLSLAWDLRDDRLDPTSGYYLSGEARPFLGLGTTGSGLRLTADARAYRGFGRDDRVVLAGRLQVGSVLGPTLLSSPRDYLFYSGGGGTVRGQEFQSLGVLVLKSGDQRTGGQHFVGLQSEARVKVTEKIGIVGFLDAGTISAVDFGDFAEWHAGAGLGLRYDTGLGPIRVDVGIPVAGGGSGAQVYIGLGQAF